MEVCEVLRGMLSVADISSSFRDRSSYLHLSNGDELYSGRRNNSCLLVGEFICHNDQNPNSKINIKNSTKLITIIITSVDMLHQHISCPLSLRAKI